MASTVRRVPTFHVVPRFDIAAIGGPLSLGTIVTDLEKLIPLNRGEFHVQVPENLKYTPVRQTEFKDTLIKVRKANFGAWLKALGLPVGASANAGGSNDLEEIVSCDSIVTSYFDPDPEGNYVQECLAVKPIQDWLDAANKHTASLYLITGLKVARKLTFNKSSSTEKHGEGKLEVEEPHTSAVDVGVFGGGSDNTKQDLEFMVDDIVIGYRVHNYRCARGFFSKERKTNDSGVLTGDMMNNEQSEAEQPKTTFELLPVPEETAAQRQAIMDGAVECWVGRVV